MNTSSKIVAANRNLKRRVFFQALFVSLLILIFASFAWVWQTIAIRSDLAMALAKSVERDIQVGDLRNSIMNLERGGGALFVNVSYSDSSGKNRFSTVPSAHSTIVLSTSVPMSEPQSDTRSAQLIFTYDPSEGSGRFFLFVIPFIIIFAVMYFEFNVKREADYFAFQTKIRFAEVQAEIASQVAHDIRSPLSGLSIVTSAIKDEVSQEKLSLLIGSVKRIKEIADDLLASKKSVALERTSLLEVKRLVELIIEEKNAIYQEREGFSIVSKFSINNDQIILIEKAQFCRLFSNILNNAIEASIGKVRISIFMKSKAHDVLFEISDAGKGIPTDVLNKLGAKGITFGKKGSSSGNGLGVYHAKKTVESFGGSFEVTSALSKGTVVKIKIPISQSENLVG